MKKYDVKLVQLPQKVLREKSVDISLPLSQEDIDLAEKMIYHIDDSQKPGTKFRPGVGVAAVQYGVLKNMFYINSDFGPKNQHVRDVFINPKIIATSEQEIAIQEGEGCLSVGDNIKNQEGFVFRKNRIVFKAYSYFNQKEMTFDFVGYPAIVAQHEIDHLNGKLFIDHIDKKQPWKDHPNSVKI
ncbi:peptide deformylase [Mycoplasmopsis maculosa]|uniref:Peptide deformylase n=1 Tax=Mycoplasmopsis maculosa TaxID=114885 RepID=A0A449B518_9BACT|nr:peptide deformylase [Mycoplasmopsis maculosa]VEU75666.1 peptide deformylase [Mycoplasmopsis maculosa]